MDVALTCSELILATLLPEYLETGRPCVSLCIQVRASIDPNTAISAFLQLGLDSTRDWPFPIFVAS